MTIKSKRDVIISFIKIISPVIIGFSVLTIVGLLIVGNFQIKYWSLISGYFFPPLGKETIIPAGIIAGINPLIMALSIAFVDIIVALFLVWNYDLAKKIPLIGSFIDKIEKIGKKTSSKYNWIKPLRFIGIMLFVMVPFQGSGGLVGSIIGRLIGVKPWNIFFAISAGSIFGCILIAYFSEIILSILISNLLLGFLLIIMVITIVIMYFSYNKLIKNNT
ncbi:MAG: small multi-drug export protein [Thermoplasmatales archaeon]|jgi:uncharacterized membrane protein|nr:small multi-drug export protein [Thermoplasmatales archaeon]